MQMPLCMYLVVESGVHMVSVHVYSRGQFNEPLRTAKYVCISMQQQMRGIFGCVLFLEDILATITLNFFMSECIL